MGPKIIKYELLVYLVTLLCSFMPRTNKLMVNAVKAKRTVIEYPSLMALWKHAITITLYSSGNVWIAVVSRRTKSMI